MSDPVRSILTEAGPLAVRDLTTETIELLGTLFPAVTEIEVDGRRLLGLVPVDGPRILEGLRTGYGYYAPQSPEVFASMLAIERLRIVEATASFRARKFKGILVPAACQTGSPGRHSQLGELMFLRTRGPLEHGLGRIDPISGYEKSFGISATDVIFSFVKDIIAAWKAGGVGDRKITDMESCPADWTGMQWRADIALVDERIFVIRPQLVSEDPLLAALVHSGVSEIEYAPSVILRPPPEAPNAT